MQIFKIVVDVGVHCVKICTLLILINVASSLTQTTERFEIRLRDGDLGAHEGRLEIYHEDNWGTVTNTGWGINEANVVCRQLGFVGSFPASVGHRFAQGLHTSVLDKVKCFGNETRLDECSNLGWYGCSGDCTGDNEVGVRCITKPMPDPLNQLRLMGGASQFEGLVEVRYNEDWGSVCGADFTFVDAITVCRQLGYGPPKHSRKFSQDDIEIRPKLIFRVSCDSWQRSLLECRVNDEPGATCGPSDPAAYVACNKPADPYPLYLDSQYNEYEGTVRIYSNVKFGTICDTGWNENAAEVACRQLGYGSVVNFRGGSYYGPSPEGQPIMLEWLQCTGRESLLAECGHERFMETTCTHLQEASVHCNEPELQNFTLRIADGNAYGGRLEVAYNGQWMAICNNSWDMKAASVACRQIGLGPALSATADYSSAPQAVLWKRVECLGTEDRLDQCQTSRAGQQACPDEILAGVTCSVYGKPNQNKDEIRLTAGILPYEGAIQVYTNGAWQAVCPSGWDPGDAAIACRQLGYSGATSSRAFTAEGPFGLDRVMCEGTEERLTKCRHSIPQRGTSCGEGTTDQAGVTCNPFLLDQVSSGATIPLRLVGGRTQEEGLVEARYDGTWGAVCRNANWNMDAANVVCRQLGYEHAVAASIEGFIPGTEQTFLVEDVSCIGSEVILSACAHGPWGQVRCPGKEAATVICRGKQYVPGVNVWMYIAIILIVILIFQGSSEVFVLVYVEKRRRDERRIRQGDTHLDVRHTPLEQQDGRAEGGAATGGHEESKIGESTQGEDQRTKEDNLAPGPGGMTPSQAQVSPDGPGAGPDPEGSAQSSDPRGSVKVEGQDPEASGDNARTLLTDPEKQLSDTEKTTLV